jgi:hypothetical protein
MSGYFAAQKQNRPEKHMTGVATATVIAMGT